MDKLSPVAISIDDMKDSLTNLRYLEKRERNRQAYMRKQAGLTHQKYGYDYQINEREFSITVPEGTDMSSPDEVKALSWFMNELWEEATAGGGTLRRYSVTRVLGTKEDVTYSLTLTYREDETLVLTRNLHAPQRMLTKSIANGTSDAEKEDLQRMLTALLTLSIDEII